MTETKLKLSRRLVLGAGVAAAAAMPIAGFAADDPNITDRSAYDRQQAGQMIIVDVRTPQEWQQTGVAVGAEPIDMNDPQFLQKLAELRQQNPGTEFGFICRSGNRSGQVQSFLAQNNVPDVYSVSGGMSGNGQSAGWIADGLPVEPWTGQ
ncbi:MAG: rhodanese-like domain-containing protein [Hyphomicrobiaceae bacterium]|nr:rhodanese-like domain-containing protein [Hyphomicrobiaceae bacterium]